MINSEKNILLQETEYKPNRYAMLCLVCMFFGSIVCWAMNELGAFRVDPTVMRIGVIPPTLFVVVLVVLSFVKKDFFVSPVTKWLTLASGALFTLTLNALMYFHTTIILLLPIFIAMLYRSKRLAWVACAVSMGLTVVCPIVGYLLGVWDVPLFQELILIVTGETPVVDVTPAPVSWLNVGKIVLYLVFPRVAFVTPCAVLMFYIVDISCKHVRNQILLDKISHRDALTGLYNRNYFNTVLGMKDKTGKVGVIFFDVNGLKKANDTFGHEYGDLLLSRSAKSLTDVCDGDVTNGFRMGGDEFLLLMEGVDENAVKAKIAEWQSALNRVNEPCKDDASLPACSLACGYACGDFDDLEKLVSLADNAMYENKKAVKKAIG